MAYYGGVKELHVSTTDTAIAVAIAIGGMILALVIAVLISIIINYVHDHRSGIRGGHL